MRLNKRFLSVLSVFALSVVACGKNNPAPSIEEPDNYAMVQEFDEPVDMHTEAQKAFVEYDEGYENLTSDYITTNFGCDGKKNISAPAGIPVEFEYEPTGDIDHYELEVSLDRDFEDSLTFKCNKDERKITAYNLYIGMEYFYRIKAVYEDGFEDVSNTRRLETADIAPRNLVIDGMTNCRDLGGRNTVDGGRTRQGLLYRTAALDDSLSKSIITDLGREQFATTIDPNTEIELRGGPKGEGGEYSTHEDYSEWSKDINYQYVPFAYENGKNLLFRNIEPVRKVFDVLGDESNYPIFFHCRIGTDRTGLIAFLVNSLCGVELQEVFQDYLFSDFGCIGKVPTVGQANEDSIAGYVETLRTFPGEKLQNKVYNFLMTAGVPASTLNNIINILTEPNSVEGNDVKKVHAETVDHMDTNGMTVSSASEIRQPTKYVTFNAAGKKVTYNFNSDKEFSADLYANLVSKTTSGTLSGAFKVTVNGSPITVENTNFKTTELGFDSTIECWIPSKLGNVSINEGSNVVEIESLTSTSIKMSQFAFSSMTAPANITVA